MKLNLGMNKVNIHCLNVGAGDSIVIEFESEINHYVVIDSCLIKKNKLLINPAYELLKSKNIKNISTLIITHLHADHYNGVEQLLNNFSISKIVVPPFLTSPSKIYRKKIIDSYTKKIEDLFEICSDDDIIQFGKSLTYLLHYLIKNENDLEEVSGKESILRFPGVNIEAKVLLPLKKIKGRLQHLIDKGDYDLNNFPEMNDSSIAVKFDCFGYNILLAGDSTKSQWNEHKRFMRRDGIDNMGINILKAPHHGSKHDNDKELYQYLLTESDTKKYLIISANGMQHPDKEIFRLIDEFNLKPYCTNFSANCLPPSVIPFKSMPNIPDKMRSHLRHYVEGTPHPCQGDIQLTFSRSGISINNSTGVPCVY